MARGTLEERFWAKVDKSGDCWLWTGATARGYGKIFVRFDNDGKQVNEGVHRVALQLTGIDIPSNLEVDHLCGTKNCVRADHMQLVPHQVNSFRALYRSQCKRGHPRTKYGPCQACHRERNRNSAPTEHYSPSPVSHP